MAMIQVKGLSEATGELSQTVPAGQYNARIVKVEDTVTGDKSKNPGRPMLKFTIKLLGDEGKDKQLYQFIMLPCEGMDADMIEFNTNKLKHLAIACGLNLSDEFDTGDFMGTEFKAVVALVTKDGKIFNELKDQLPL